LFVVTSIVLVIGSPEAEPAQPRALIGGHIVATLVGLAMPGLTGPHAWAAAVAVGLAILAMYVTGTFLPPAGINPLLVWHRRPWPQRWLSGASGKAISVSRLGVLSSIL